LLFLEYSKKSSQRGLVALGNDLHHLPVCGIRLQLNVVCGGRCGRFEHSQSVQKLERKIDIAPTDLLNEVLARLGVVPWSVEKRRDPGFMIRQ
jgi:hypothetical protein